MKKVEIVLSQTYLYKGKVFEKGKGPYAVTDKVAKHLLAQRNERDIPYFRESSESPAMIPGAKRSDKGGKPREAKEPGAETAAAEKPDESDETEVEAEAEAAEPDVDDDESIDGLDDLEDDEDEDDPEAVTV